MPLHAHCVFCAIVDRREPAAIRYEDDAVIVFDNVLRWSRLMLLAAPKDHRSQSELWSDLGAVGRVALAMGRQHAPQGFRLLSNFGLLGMQSQPHGHVHILDQTEPRLEPQGAPRRSVVEVIRAGGRELLRTAATVLYDETALFPYAPVTALAVPADGRADSGAVWANLGSLGADVVAAGWTVSEGGFRLLANFPGEETLAGGEQAHLHLLGGAFLGDYA